jgi:hypothetical protein
MKVDAQIKAADARPLSGSHMKANSGFPSCLVGVAFSPQDFGGQHKIDTTMAGIFCVAKTLGAS